MASHPAADRPALASLRPVTSNPPGGPTPKSRRLRDTPSHRAAPGMNSESACANDFTQFDTSKWLLTDQSVSKWSHLVAELTFDKAFACSTYNLCHVHCK
ncbi:hypothetical protein RHECNPAF_430044 [Rhizobium etli CNPAF512]|nr:hypothetical protein RHECNPAF_430044 [Rhizobium etli CNPAF512]